MRNLLLIVCALSLCGCRVELLQLFGAIIETEEPDQFDAARTYRVADFSDDAGIEELDDVVDSDIYTEDAGLSDTGVVDARPPYSEICLDVEPGGTCLAHGYSCPSGFYDVHGNGRLCQEIDECDIEDHNCTVDQRCENTAGSFRCL